MYRIRLKYIERTEFTEDCISEYTGYGYKNFKDKETLYEFITELSKHTYESEGFLTKYLIRVSRYRWYEPLEIINDKDIFNELLNYCEDNNE